MSQERETLLRSAYENGLERMKNALCEEEWLLAADAFAQAEDHADAGEKRAFCLETAAEMNRSALYALAADILDKAESSSGLLSAAGMLKQLGEYKDAPELLERCMNKAAEMEKEDRYEQAKRLLNRMEDSTTDCDSAKAMFEALSGYRDSAEYIAKCEHKKESILIAQEAKRQLDEKERAARKKRLRILIRLGICALLLAILIPGGIHLTNHVIIPEKKYRHALDLYSAGEYEQAYRAFLDCRNYKETEKYLSEDPHIRAALRTVQQKACRVPGSQVMFGRFEQDDREDNGPEDVVWFVLDYDEETDTALLVSRYVLETQQYEESYGEVDWEHCSLRRYLNGAFYEKVFTGDEQTAIVLSRVDNSPAQGYSRYSGAGGNDTEDRVYLLSYSEMWKYFNNEYSRQPVPTVWASNHPRDGVPTRCFLRSPGDAQTYAALVYDDGTLTGSAVGNRRGICPVIRVNVGILATLP